MNMPFLAWRPSGGLLAALGLAAATTTVIWWPRPDAAADATRAEPPPLFTGWVKPGRDFGQDEEATLSRQPKWVLATEPDADEIQALQSTLSDQPDHADHPGELRRLIDQSRFQKQMALWNELRNGPMTAERATLSKHLLEELPAHFGRGEMMGAQAVLMAKALIQELEPNPQRQGTKLAEAQSRLKAQALSPSADRPADAAVFDASEDAPRRMPSEQHNTEQNREQNTARNDQQPEARLEAMRRAMLEPTAAGLPR